MAVSFILASLRDSTYKIRFVPSFAAAALNAHFDHPANQLLIFQDPLSLVVTVGVLGIALISLPTINCSI